MRFIAVVGSVLLFYGANVLAQAGTENPFSPGAEVVKIGLGVASFLALVWFLKWMAAELKASRVEGLAAQAAAQNKFLESLDKQHKDHSEEMRLLREHNERQVVRLHAAIDEVGKNSRE